MIFRIRSKISPTRNGPTRNARFGADGECSADADDVAFCPW